MSATSQDYVKWFRHSSPYINAHRGKTFVVMLPGAAMLDDNFANIIHDLALLHTLGIKLVLVHGARPQIDAQLASQGSESVFENHLRVTDQQDIQAIIQAIASARCQIESALSTGLPNSPMHGVAIRTVSGNYVTARPWGVVNGVDLQHTGKVRKVDVEALNIALNNNAITLLSPQGYSPTGEIFNLSFADVATAVVTQLQADKLIAYTSEDGYRNQDGELLRQMTLAECACELEKLEAGNDHSQSLLACYNACQQGVPRAQMISYKQDGALLRELFTREGSGTLVHSDTYETVRKASIDDVGGILELITPLEQQGALVRRSRELLESEIDRFNIMEMDGTIVACMALYPHGEIAELACVATHPDYQKGGRAAALLSATEQQAREQHIDEIFVLTTQTAHWFIEQGFVAAQLERLPESKKSLYNFQRNSKIFIKKLT
ncbi:MAG: amino-acid N-acetyltransferase [Candidatus Pelagadaptatus aseana]|uniref:amino-acid N-acetyltransferase n=1 Tax=Candidatus Pelagadaptatus aseana TaxID=3120508 RepID=UPI0039B3274F